MSQRWTLPRLEHPPRPRNRRPDSQSADAPTDLRAVTECTGSSVVIHVGGDIDASNESTWQRLLSRSAAKTVAPGSVRHRRFATSNSWGPVPMPPWRTRRWSVAVVASICGWSPASRSWLKTIAVCGLRTLLPTYATVETAFVAVGLALGTDQAQYVTRATPRQGHAVAAVSVIVDAGAPDLAARPPLAPTVGPDAAR